MSPIEATSSGVTWLAIATASSARLMPRVSLLSASAMSGARVATPSAPIAKLPTLDTGEPLARGKSTLEAPAVTPPANDNDRATRHKLLLVEDEPLVRKATARMLTRLGYEVITAENGVEALALCREGADFAVVVSDVVMPQMGGPQLANALQGLERAPKVLLVSGHTGDDACSADKLPRGVALMSKPFRRAQIEQMLRQLLSTDMCHTSAVDLAHAVTAAAPDLAQN